MNSTARLLATLCFLASTVAYDRPLSADTVISYGGEPYLGKVDVNGYVPDNFSNGIEDSGTGSAYFTKTEDGKIRLVVTGNINQPSDAGFVVEGIETDSGWSSSEGGVNIVIGKDGKISGSGVSHPNRLLFNGLVSAENFDLEVETELLEANQKGLPPGTKIIFSYDLQRTIKREEADAVVPGNSENTNRPCKRTVWQVRNIANLSGGPMIMTQVPVCVEK